MSRIVASESTARSRRRSGSESGLLSIVILALLLLSSLAIALVAAAIPFAFVGSAALIGAILVVAFLKQNVSTGLFWAILVSLAVLLLGTAVGMINTLFLTPVEVVTVHSGLVTPGFG